MDLPYKKILLTQGKFAIVDAEDFDKLNKYKWYILKRANTYYAARKIRVGKKRTSMYMHREVLGILKGFHVDHINHNGLDNRKANLRICSNQENQLFQQRKKGYTSQYKGVFWRKDIKKWQARIRINKKQKSLGFFADEKEAAITYDKAVKKTHKEFAVLNFPNEL